MQRYRLRRRQHRPHRADVARRARLSERDRRQGPLRDDVSVLPDGSHRVGRRLRTRTRRLERPVRRLRPRRTDHLRSQPAHRRPRRPLDVDIRTATLRPQLRALPVPRRARARRRAAARDATRSGGRTVRQAPDLAQPTGRRRPSDDVGRRPRV